ncbi:hypothetical protein Hanom_Chr09g00801831 [Helianthus anomalus]
MARSFRQLMLNVSVPDEYGACYPKEGDNAADAPTRFITHFADFFGKDNFLVVVDCIYGGITGVLQNPYLPAQPIGDGSCSPFQVLFPIPGS